MPNHIPSKPKGASTLSDWSRKTPVNRKSRSITVLNLLSKAHVLTSYSYSAGPKHPGLVEVFCGCSRNIESQRVPHPTKSLAVHCKGNVNKYGDTKHDNHNPIREKGLEWHAHVLCTDLERRMGYLRIMPVAAGLL